MSIAGDRPRQLAPTVGTTGSGSTSSPVPSSLSTSESHLAGSSSRARSHLVSRSASREFLRNNQKKLDRPHPICSTKINLQQHPRIDRLKPESNQVLHVRALIYTPYINLLRLRHQPQSILFGDQIKYAARSLYAAAHPVFTARTTRHQTCLCSRPVREPSRRSSTASPKEKLDQISGSISPCQAISQEHVARNRYYQAISSEQAESRDRSNNYYQQ
jgi:hypothetical protein